MPTTILTWTWEEAFDKFGFGDGDGIIMTHVVANVLDKHGYNVSIMPWGLHNDIITSIIARDGTEQIPATANLGYDDPRHYLPECIVELLDADLQTAASTEVHS
ncbi:MAG: hypothetical protein ABL908_10115 [Hyphomicrobium sp.]